MKEEHSGEGYFNKSPPKLNHKCQVQESNYTRTALVPFLLFSLSPPPPLYYFIAILFVFLLVCTFSSHIGSPCSLTFSLTRLNFLV